MLTKGNSVVTVLVWHPADNRSLLRSKDKNRKDLETGMDKDVIDTDCLEIVCQVLSADETLVATNTQNMSLENQHSYS